jgi:hypothetical protein
MRCITKLVTILSAFAALSACTDAGQTLLILRDSVPLEGCVVNAGETGDFISAGRIDTQAAYGYIFTPVVKNLATNKIGQNEQGTNIAFIEGAEVNIEFRDPNFFSAEETEALGGLAAYTVLFGGTITPSGTAGFAFDVLPKALLDEIEGRLPAGGSTDVTSKVTIFGELDGGTVESQEWAHSINVCNGCMTRNLGLCTALPLNFIGQYGGECNQLQDFPVECCEDPEGNQRCPATPN